MPRGKHPQKAQVPHTLKRAPLRARNRIRLQRRIRKRRRPRILYRVRGRQPPKPIADPIRIPRPDERRETRLHDGAERGEERPGIIPRGGEFVVWRVRTLLISCLGADLIGDGRGLEVADVGGRGIGIVARGADIVDVEVGGLAEGAFDVVVAGVVCGDAGGIRARDRGAGLQSGQALRVVG